MYAAVVTSGLLSPYASLNGRTLRTLALLKPDDLLPAWRMVVALEQAGEMDAAETSRGKDGIFQLMKRWNLEPDHLISPFLD